MKQDSTISHKLSVRWWSILFWLALWMLASWKIGETILLVSPIAVCRRLVELLPTLAFWQTIGFSLWRILLGFALGAVGGIVLAILCSASRFMAELWILPMAAVKSTPVASFIILVLLWVPTPYLSVVIAFLIVLPVVFSNCYEGIRSTDQKLLEMATVFQVPRLRQWRYIYGIHLLPYLQSAFSVTLGMAWKAGIAAEVIGQPPGAIGNALYRAKIYLDTPSLFAWTLVIIVLSIFVEKFMLWAMAYAIRHLKGGQAHAVLEAADQEV